MANFFRFLYQWLIFMPIFTVITLLCAFTVIITTPLFGSKFWGYYPPKWWSRLTCWFSLCCVKVTGRSNLNPNQSYVFVANHQSAFDIFLIYGFLNQNIKWVQKQSLRKIPFVGFASEKAGHVFVDNSSPAARFSTINKAKEQLTEGVSMVLFPEGARTKTGKMTRFQRGAFQIAIDMKLPIVPLTINGAYDILKIGTALIKPGKMELTIHEPIPTEALTEEDIAKLMGETKGSIQSALWEKYKNNNEQMIHQGTP